MVKLLPIALHDPNLAAAEDAIVLKHTKESREKISSSKKGSIVSQETRNKHSLLMTGKKIHSDEFKQQRKKLMLENNPSKMYRMLCEHCNKEMSKSNHTKWHGSKCKNYLSFLQSGI